MRMTMSMSITITVLLFMTLVVSSKSSSLSPSSVSTSGSASTPTSSTFNDVVINVQHQHQNLQHDDNEYSINIHYTCFGKSVSYSGEHEYKYEHEHKKKCCLEIIQKRNDIISTNSVEEKGRRNEHDCNECMNSIAKVPMIHSNKKNNNDNIDDDDDDDDQSLLIPLYYLNEDINIDINTNDNPSSSNDDNDTVDKIPMICSPFHNQEKIHELNDGHNNSSSNSNTFTASLDSIFSTEGGMHRSFTHALKIDVPVPVAHENEKFQNEYNEGTTESSVKIASTSANIVGEMILYLPILKGYFIDLDDPFQMDSNDEACQISFTTFNSSSSSSHHSPELFNIQKSNTNDENASIQTETKCQIEVITSVNEVIDIEQPSFATSQHVVALRISYNVNIIQRNEGEVEGKGKNNGNENIKLLLANLSSSSPSSSLVINFVPMMHLRYQSPILEENDNDNNNHTQQQRTDGFIPMKVSNAFLHSGTMNTKLESKSNHDTDSIHSNFFYTLDSSAYISTSASKSTPPSQQQINEANAFIIEVAVGLDKHHDIVMIFTMIACIIGALQMIRDFSKVGLWY